MNLDENLTDVFDRFLNGQMNEAEAKEFLQQLETDPALKEVYEWHRNIVAGIREARREEMKDYMRKNANIRYIGNIWGRSWVMTSAAIVAIFLASYVAIEYFVKPSPNKEMATNSQVDSVKNDSLQLRNEDGQTAHQTTNEPSSQKDTQQSPVNGTQEQNQPENNAYAQNDGNSPNAENKKSVNVYVVNKSVVKNRNNQNMASQEDNVAAKQLWVYFKQANTYNYQYSKDRLTLYKVKYDERVALYEVGKASYLGWNNNYYPLKQDGSVHSLDKLSDTSILKALPKLK